MQYYEKASNTEKLVECYYLLEDYDNLENLIDLLQPNDPLLISMGQMFASVGMGKQSVEAFLKCNKISNAIGKLLQFQKLLSTLFEDFPRIFSFLHIFLK